MKRPSNNKRNFKRPLNSRRTLYDTRELKRKNCLRMEKRSLKSKNSFQERRKNYFFKVEKSLQLPNEKGEVAPRGNTGSLQAKRSTGIDESRVMPQGKPTTLNQGGKSPNNREFRGQVHQCMPAGSKKKQEGKEMSDREEATTPSTG